MVAYSFPDSFKVLIGEHLNQKSWIVNEEECVVIMGEYFICSKGESADHTVKRGVNSLCCFLRVYQVQQIIDSDHSMLEVLGEFVLI